jgi:hypothetical protein
MARLKQKDLQDIIRLFDYELNALSRMSKVEKMKIRKKIVNALSTISALNIKKPELFMSTLEGKLYNVFDVFMDSWGFRERLEKRINQIFEENQENIEHPVEDE